MAIPTKKSPGINALGDSLLPVSSKGRVASMTDVCAWCGKPVTGFRDALSAGEYRISGLCQKCQDETFGAAE